MSDLTEYERERIARIAENKKLLQSLQIDRDSRVSRDGTPEIKPKAVKRKAAATVKREATQGLRVSTRSRTQRTASLAARDPEAAKRKVEEEEEEERLALEAARKARHADREIEVWNPTGRVVIEEAAVPLRQLLHSVADTGSWKREVHALIKASKAEGVNGSSPITPVTTSKRATPGRNGTLASSGSRSRRKAQSVKKEESDSEDDKVSQDRIGITRLRETFDNMELKAVKRINPDRVYSLAVHPTTDKDLVFVGDRKGWLGIWNASADAEEQLTKDENEENKLDAHAFAQRVYNDHGTIACLRFDPIKAHTVYASSYDCTIRSLNFEVGVWSEVVDIDLLAAKTEGEGEALIGAFEFTQDGNQMWISDNRGGLTHADIRESKKQHRRWKIAESKAGCVSINPANENLLVTSHLNRDMRIWDARKLMKIDSVKSDYYTTYEKACVASYQHGKAVTSAYFDPSGRNLLSTCYDDKIRIWDVNPSKLDEDDFDDFEPRNSIYHDNNTGAYTSVFKATWSSNPLVEPYFTIGNMKRCLDVYTKEGKLITQLSEGVSTIPAVTCGHPSQPALFGGAAGGKIYYWRADKWA